MICKQLIWADSTTIVAGINICLMFNVFKNHPFFKQIYIYNMQSTKCFVWLKIEAKI